MNMQYIDDKFQVEILVIFFNLSQAKIKWHVVLWLTVYRPTVIAAQ